VPLLQQPLYWTSICILLPINFFLTICIKCFSSLKCCLLKNLKHPKPAVSILRHLSLHLLTILNGRIRRNLLIESESFCQYSHLVLLTKKFTGKETTISTAPHVIIVILKRLFFLSGLFSWWFCFFLLVYIFEETGWGARPQLLWVEKCCFGTSEFCMGVNKKFRSRLHTWANVQRKLVHGICQDNGTGTPWYCCTLPHRLC